MPNPVLGIDVGATGVKGALVDIDKGELLHKRVRILTPQPATPDAIADVVFEIADQLDYHGPVGVGFPSIIKNGICASANNIDPSWIGVSVTDKLSQRLSRPVRTFNDADCAGVAESRFGQIRGVEGVALLLTLGTGIGSAFFYNGKLVPNLELGNLRIDKFRGKGEKYVSNKARKDHHLSWKQWGKRFDKFLHVVDEIFSPNVIVLGGGISKKFEKYGDFLTVDTKVVPARLFNDSGIIGAAMLWEDH
jgi:polyphosphate glucokinase